MDREKEREKSIGIEPAAIDSTLKIRANDELLFFGGSGGALHDRPGIDR